MDTKNKKILNSFRVEEELLKRNMLIFSPFELKQIFNVSQKNTSFFINYNVKKGVFIKLKNGFYALKNHFPPEVEIANRIYSPSYISLEYAMSHYNIIPETVYSITSITTKTTREFVINNISYSYRKIKKSGFTGYAKKNINGHMALIAEPEKAFIDYLYFVSLGKKSVYDRIETKNLKKEKLIYYAKLFKKNSIVKLLNNIYVKNRRNKEVVY